MKVTAVKGALLVCYCVSLLAGVSAADITCRSRPKPNATTLTTEQAQARADEAARNCSTLNYIQPRDPLVPVSFEADLEFFQTVWPIGSGHAVPGRVNSTIGVCSSRIWPVQDIFRQLQLDSVLCSDLIVSSEGCASFDSSSYTVGSSKATSQSSGTSPTESQCGTTYLDSWGLNPRFAPATDQIFSSFWYAASPDLYNTAAEGDPRLGICIVDFNECREVCLDVTLWLLAFEEDMKYFCSLVQT